MIRSPNYPALSLPAALNESTKIWKRHERAVMTEEEIASCMGYKSLSGPARVKLSALKKYGLLTKQGSGWKLSNRAIAIVLREADDPERKKAEREAFLDVPLFSELYNKHPNSTKGSILIYLRENKEFTQDGAESLYEAYSASKSLAPVDQSRTMPEVKDSGESESSSKGEAVKPKEAIVPYGQNTATLQELTFPLIGGGLAILKVPVPMSEKSYNLLMAMLTTMKDGIVAPTDKGHDNHESDTDET